MPLAPSQRNRSVPGHWLTSRLRPGSATAAVVPRLLQMVAAGNLYATVKHLKSVDKAAKAH